jgi:hypothetical protein
LEEAKKDLEKLIKTKKDLYEAYVNPDKKDKKDKKHDKDKQGESGGSSAEVVDVDEDVPSEDNANTGQKNKKRNAEDEAEKDVNPSPAPCTVTLADPVAAALPLYVFDSVGASTEYKYALDRVPDRSPAVTDIILHVPWSTPACWQTIALLETHLLDSKLVWPTLANKVIAAAPRFAPCTVTLADPVAGQFRLIIEEIVTMSTEYTSECVPARSPEVTTILRL